MATPEGRVKRKLDEAIREVKQRYHEYPIWYFSPQAGAFGKAGVPDRIGCVAGRFFAVECKAPGGQVTALQAKALGELSDAGATVFIFYGADAALDNIIKWIEAQIATYILLDKK